MSRHATPTIHPSPRSAPSSVRRRGLSFVEVLVALLISLIFVAAIASAFIATLRSSEQAQAEANAHNRARGAVEAIAEDVRNLQLDPNLGIVPLTFRIVNQTLAYGDRVDNDDDGRRDEEVVNGLDEDGDFIDQHVFVGTSIERPYYILTPDVGDRRVDEDCRFGNDSVTFVQLPPRGAALPPFATKDRVTYYVGTWNGENNVLIRERVFTDPTSLIDTVTQDPVAFDVVSLDLLAYNTNSYGLVSEQPSWFESWDTLTFPLTARPYLAPVGVPPFAYPATLFIRVGVNAERTPLAEIDGFPFANRPLKVAYLETEVVVESVLGSPDYDGFVREP